MGLVDERIQRSLAPGLATSSASVGEAPASAAHVTPLTGALSSSTGYVLCGALGVTAGWGGCGEVGVTGVDEVLDAVADVTVDVAPDAAGWR